MRKGFLLAFILTVAAAATPVSAEAQVNSSLEITDLALVALTGITAVPQEINEGGTVDVSLSIENQGNVEAGVQANITILNSTGDRMQNTVFAAFNMTPGETAVLTYSWNAGSNPIGDYSANGLAVYDSTLTNAVNANFSIVSVPTPTAAPTPGGGSGGGDIQIIPRPKPLPPEIKPEYGVIEFSKKVILVEILAGSARVESIALKNADSKAREVQLALSGAPKDSLSADSNRLVIQPGRSATVSLGFSIPKDAEPGDYLVKLAAVSGEAQSTDYLILRVKSYPEGYANPITTKTVVMDVDKGETQVRVAIFNPSEKKVERIQLFDRVPLSAAKDPSRVVFSEKVGVVVSRVPLELAWELRDVLPGEHVTIAYAISGLLDDYAPYAASVVRTAAFNTEEARGLLQVREFRIPPLYVGKTGEVTALLFYGGLESAKASLFLEAPLNGFSVEPKSLDVAFAPRSIRRVSFNVTPFSQEAVGSNVMTLVVASEDFGVRQEAGFIVYSPAGFEGFDWAWLVLLAALVVAAAVLIGRHAGARKQRQLENRFRSLTIEERDGYLKVVREGVLGKK